MPSRWPRKEHTGGAKGVKFLEHPVLQTWPLSPEAQGSPLPDLWASMPAHALGQALLADVARLSSSASVASVRQWEVMYGPLADVVVAWLAWAPVAKALAVGAWRADVTARFKRSDTGHTSDAPVLPSARLLKYFGTLPCVDIAPPDGYGGVASSVQQGRVPPLPPARVVEGLRLGSALRSQRLADAALSTTQGFFN
jgi:hypothetical protein